jgi:tRNA (guanine37-N1)-methyltransferase
MRADVIEKAFLDNLNIEEFIDNPKKQIILPSPRGEKFCQQVAQEISNIDEIAVLCNRYEGIDQRAIEYFKMRQICVGEYILMGGETACMCILEASCRLITGILHNPESLKNETFSGSYNENIECDQYTLPREWNGLTTPNVLLSGDHAKIAEWRGEKNFLKYKSKKH